MPRKKSEDDEYVLKNYVNCPHCNSSKHKGAISRHIKLYCPKNTELKLSDEVKRLSKIEEDALRFKELLLKNPPKRPGITYKRKLELVIKQKGVCNLCNNELEENNYDFDHKIPWSQSFDNSDGNIQILCLTCHRKKTVKACSLGRTAQRP